MPAEWLKIQRVTIIASVLSGHALQKRYGCNYLPMRSSQVNCVSKMDPWCDQTISLIRSGPIPRADGQHFVECSTWRPKCNKANLRDLVSATGLVILLKLDSNRRFFSRETPNLGQNRQFFWPCDLEIWRMTFKNNRAPLLCYFNPCAAFRGHWWIQTGVTVRKRPIWVKIDYFFSRVTSKFDGWPSKTIGHLS